MSTLKTGDTSGSPPIKWILLGLLSHAAWGGYPVLARYIQNVGHVPPLLMGSLANGIASLALLLIIVPRIKISFPSVRDLIFFGVVTVLRSLTNIFAARFTGAIYVQLISLMTPFIVALLSMPMLGEHLPRFTVPAVCLSVCGAVLIVTSDPGNGGISFALTRSDFIGIGLALVSSFFLAFYMLMIRKVVRSDTPAEVLGTFQALVLFLFMTSGSLAIGEDWSSLARLPLRGWAAIVIYGLGVILAGTLLQNTALKHIRASFYTVMLAMRLVSTTVFAALILGERLTSVWQGIGALVVMAAVTFYTWSQNRPAVPPPV